MWRMTGAVLLTTWCLSAVGVEPVPATPFEAFATRADVAVREATLVGTLRSDDSVATLTALVLEDANGARKIGLRIDLQSNTAMDSVYLDQAEIVLAKRELGELVDGSADLLHPSGDGGARWREQGTGRCWNRDPEQRILCPSFNVGPDRVSLTLGALGGPYFSFPGHSPSELITLVETASDDLATKSEARGP
jgi:hypothetical protein